MIRRQPERAAGRRDTPAGPAPAVLSLRTKCALILAALAAVGGGLFALRSPATGERSEALRLAREGHYAEADPLLQRALAQDANDAEVVSALALSKLWANEPTAAEGYLTRWIELRPQEANPLRLRMNMLHHRGNAERARAARLRMLEQAANDGQRLLELEPNNDEVRRELVPLLVNVGRFAEAEQTCRRCLERMPGDPKLLYLLARSCHAQGKRSEAEAILDSVVRDQPGYAEALALRATLYREADQPDKAIPLLRQAMAQDRSPHREYRYELALALAGTGQAEEARRVMAELQQQALEDAVVRDHLPNTAAMRVLTAEAMLEAGKADGARAVLDQVLAEAPDFAPAHRVLALYFEQQGQPDKAAEHRRRAGS